MDVEAGEPALPRGVTTARQGRVREREGRVEPERGDDLREPAQVAALGPREAGVLLDATARHLGSVAVGDLEAGREPDAHLARRARHGLEAPLDRAFARVMVDHGRDAGPGALDEADERREVDVFLLEGAVEGPPDPLEDLVELGGRLAHERHAPGERRVEVRVGVHEPGEDDAPGGVDDLGSLAGVLARPPVGVRRLPDERDLAPAEDEPAIVRDRGPAEVEEDSRAPQDDRPVHRRPILPANRGAPRDMRARASVTSEAARILQQGARDRFGDKISG